MRYVTASEMREIDRRAIEEYGIPSLILMENAGIACARETMTFLKSKKDQAVIFAGKGNNGGDGFVTARHLANRGFSVTVFYFQSASEMKPDPLANFRILQKMKTSLTDCSEQADPRKIKNVLGVSKVVVDALFGTGLSKPIEEPFKTVIQLINESKVPVVSVDIPSGMNADTGEVLGACIRAKKTVTLALPKKGFQFRCAKRYIGKLIVADISIPKELLQ